MAATKMCNSSKQNKSFEEWYPSQDYYLVQREREIIAYINEGACAVEERK